MMVLFYAELPVDRVKQTERGVEESRLVKVTINKQIQNGCRKNNLGSRDGVVMRSLAFHQCDLG